MNGFRIPCTLPTIVICCAMAVTVEVDADFPIVRNRRPVSQIVISAPDAHPADLHAINEATELFVDAVNRSTGATIPIADSIRSGRRRPTIQLTLMRGPVTTPAEQYEISTTNSDLQIKSLSGRGIRNGVARLLDHMGFRFYAPSPKWHFVPRDRDLTTDLNVIETPKLQFRRIWYAYGVPGADLAELSDNYRRWVIANRLSIDNTVQCGHSYGNIVGRNQAVFQQHPEYFALLENGTRDIQQAINARKFCFSNPDLVKLVCADRVALLKENLAKNPALTMVSVDPSDGSGTCHCKDCEQLGTPTDRVFFLANAVARSVRTVHPDARVGLYAYSSHRLPPTIDVEPNVYVQVAMGFNRTQYTFTELIELWAEKVTAIGLREYYGVEAWDWGLPGRMRGADIAYHRRWIPYYAKRNLDAINAETNANWGGQTLGLYTSARLMWNPQSDTAGIEDEFYELCFGKAASKIRELYSIFDQRPQLHSKNLLEMFELANQAWETETDESVRGRLYDVMAYLIYTAKYWKFELTREQESSRNDNYYDELATLMNYVWRIRHRDTVHYYALARRLCNGLPLQDKRDEFWYARKEEPAIWMNGDTYTDQQILMLFDETRKILAADDDPSISYSRLFEPLVAPGVDNGPCKTAGQAAPALGDPTTVAHARFRGPVVGYILATEPQQIRLGIKANSREVDLVVSNTREAIKEITVGGGSAHPTQVEFTLPTANEYRLDISGDFELTVSDDVMLVFEASPANPLWVDYSGPLYFYVPPSTVTLFADGGPRFSMNVGDSKQPRVDMTRESRLKNKPYSELAVPQDSRGHVWHTTAQTRGKVSLWNVPPLLSLHRSTLVRPREIADAPGSKHSLK